MSLYAQHCSHSFIAVDYPSAFFYLKFIQYEITFFAHLAFKASLGIASLYLTRLALKQFHGPFSTILSKKMEQHHHHRLSYHGISTERDL